MLIVMLYAALAVVVYGCVLTYWQQAFPHRAYPDRLEDVGFAAFMALIAPVGFGVMLVGGMYRYGWSLHLMSKAESWAAFTQRFPSLTGPAERADWERGR